MEIIEIKNISDLEILKTPSGFDDIDIEFTKFIHRISGYDDPVLLLTSALLSYSLRKNHICMRLNDYAEKLFPFEIEVNTIEEQKYIQLPELKYWLEQLKKFPKVVSFDKETKPLVIDEKNRVYLQRYLKYEQDLSEFLIQKIRGNETISPPEGDINISQISKYFQNNTDIDYQQIAVFASLVNQFTVITGSPGTGKTTVVATILAAHYQINPTTKVGICAPTGKAAARLKESLNLELDNLTISDTIKNKIATTETSTIHRLLKVKYHTPHFFYNRENKLDIDLLILDEASMVSQPLMCKLFYSLSENTKVILLGDKDQLASVEEGSVFGDICDSLPINSFSKNFTDNILKYSNQQINPSENTRISNTIVELKKSYRFDNTKGIGLIKEAISLGNSNRVLDIGKTEPKELRIRNLPQKNIFKSQIINYLNKIKININGNDFSFQDYLAINDIDQKFQFMNKFRILCAKRNGIYGINNINRIILEHYFDSQSKYTDGMPVMITSNDNRLKLFNGDVGIVKQFGKSLKIYFPDQKAPDHYRSFAPNQLPDHEAIFAMTIHKSQGSGFQKILLVLPEKDSLLMTRELFYTGVTRAEKYCEIWSYDSIIKNCVDRITVRDSGLKDKLLSI